MRRGSLAVTLLLLALLASLALVDGAEAASLPSLLAFSFHEGVGIVRPGNPSSEHVFARRASEPAWSPNGEVLAFALHDSSSKHSSLALLDRAGDKIETIPVSIGGDPTWAPNGFEIAYVCADGPRYTAPPVFPGAPQAVSENICVVNVISGVSRVLATGNAEFSLEGDMVKALSWSPQGDSIAVEDLHSEPCVVLGAEAFCGQHEVDAVDVATGAWRRLLTTTSGAPAYSPNGRKLAYADAQGVHVASASGASPRLVTNRGAISLAWAPDGKDLVISTNAPPADNGNYDLFAVSIHGGGLKQYTKTGDDETSPTWAQAVTRCTVPKLKGQSPQATKRLIALAGCELGKVTGRRKGKNRRVIKQSPAAGANVRVGTKVDVKFR